MPDYDTDRPTRDWRQPIVWGLVAVNVVLGAAFVARMYKEPAAYAQPAGRQGDYLMVPGEVSGGTNAVVYVLDQTNHALSAMSYDDAQKTLVTMHPRDIDRDFDANNNPRRQPPTVSGRRP